MRRQNIFPVRWLGILLAASALVAGLAFIGLTPVSADSGSAPKAAVDNQTCLGCHGNPGQTYKVSPDETISISIDPDAFKSSVHADKPCTTCHTGMDTIPHNPKDLQGQQYSKYYANTCKDCHADQFKLVQDGVHNKVTDQNQKFTPACSDCHNPHTQQKVRDANGKITQEEHVAIPLICSRCHSTIYNDYSKSVHGKALLEQNPDVPTCIDCHGVHNMGDPSTANFRLLSPNICATCHTNPDIMKKYGISTEVLNTYVADFHGTTVTLFEKMSPDQLTNKPVCFDCHGVHNISKTNDPNTGLQIKGNLLKACQRCHPDISSNFPDSWLSHYIPSPDKYPLVYYVNLVYTILIPTVLGGMVIFVASDFVRSRMDRNKKKKEPGAKESEGKKE